MPATATNAFKAPPISGEGLGRGFAATEFNIYGSSRIGMVTQPEALSQKQNDTLRNEMFLGLKVYEFSNHLGNVLTTFSDRKIEVENISDQGHVAYYTSEILSSTEYYPFGFQMPGRVYEADGYRYGFNAMEKDDEVKGSGNSYDFGARIYDPRVGRWLAVDPMAQVYASFSPFCFSMLSPIYYKDIAGQFVVITIEDESQKKALETLISTVFDGKVKAQVKEDKVHGYILTMNIADNFSIDDLTKEQKEAYEYFKKNLINDPKELNCTLATSTGGDFFDNYYV